MSEIETKNDFLLGTQRGDLVVTVPIPWKVSRDQALRIATWIVVMLDRDGDFEKVLEAVRKT